MFIWQIRILLKQRVCAQRVTYTCLCKQCVFSLRRLHRLLDKQAENYIVVNNVNLSTNVSLLVMLCFVMVLLIHAILYLVNYGMLASTSCIAAYTVCGTLTFRLNFTDQFHVDS